MVLLGGLRRSLESENGTFVDATFGKYITAPKISTFPPKSSPNSLRLGPRWPEPIGKVHS